MTEHQLRDQLIDFVYRENRLLDQRRFNEWYDLFADDGLYWIPSQPDQTDKEGQVSIALESKMLLQLRIARLGHARAHSLHPQVRSMHVVQRPEVDEINLESRQHTVSCSFMYLEFQAGEQLIFGGHARYQLRQVDADLKIIEKKISLLNMDTYLPAIQLFI